MPALPTAIDQHQTITDALQSRVLIPAAAPKAQRFIAPCYGAPGPIRLVWIQHLIAHVPLVHRYPRDEKRGYWRGPWPASIFRLASIRKMAIAIPATSSSPAAPAATA